MLVLLGVSETVFDIAFLFNNFDDVTFNVQIIYPVIDGFNTKISYLTI